MKTAVVLSTEQKKVKALYETSRVWGALVSTIALEIINIMISHALRPYGYLIGANIVLCLGTGMSIGHWWGLRQVRQAGLSQELTTVEAVVKTTSHSPGDPVEWRYPKTRIGSIGFAALAFLSSAFWWWAWHTEGDLLQHFGGACFFFLSLVGGIMKLCFIFSPTLRIDSEGITICPNYLWPRKLKWSKVSVYEIQRSRIYSGDVTVLTLTFKDGAGKKLFTFVLSALQSFSAGEVEEIEAEVRRRLVS